MSDVPEEIIKQTARQLHEQGMELTPVEVTAIQKSVLEKLRNGMGKRGYLVPEGDVEFLDWMRAKGVRSSDITGKGK